MSAILAPVRPAARVPSVERSARFECMGGRVSLRVACVAGTEAAADRDLRLVAGRIIAWADRISRFEPGSELSRLNRLTEQEVVAVSPSLADLLHRARRLGALTDGLVDVTMLEARLAAEGGQPVEAAPSDWHLEPARRGHALARSSGTTFDLDGVGKGWIADRALALLRRYPAAMVDADGDIALRPGGQTDWGVAVADPAREVDLAVVAAPRSHRAASFGIATSGTTVHRWEFDTGWAHHLIDPRTGLSADTDVVQATVVAGDALTAEALAKAAVIGGSEEALHLLQRAGTEAAFLLLQSGELIAPAGAEEWLA